ncbi:hypothetical protein OHS70_11580 [Streptomyces sp. NBC_00390]
MSVLPPDRERLRILETFLALSLARVRERITYLEQKAAIRRRSRLEVTPD